MAVTQATLRTSVRNHLPNVTTTELSDAAIDEGAKGALKQMSHDSPKVISDRFTGTGGNFYNLATAAAGWRAGFSKIRSVVYPAPVIADNEQIEALEYKDYETYEDEGVDYVRLDTAPPSTESVLVRFTVPWTVISIDGETANNIPYSYENALVYLVVAHSCYILSGKSAGRLDDQIPGDFLNFRTKESEYRRVGQIWESKYRLELGISEPGKEPPVQAAMVRRDFDTVMQSGSLRLTH